MGPEEDEAQRLHDRRMERIAREEAEVAKLRAELAHHVVALKAANDGWQKSMEERDRLELQSQEYKDAADLWGTRWSRLKGNFDKLELQHREAAKMASILLDYIHALKRHEGSIENCGQEPCPATIEFLSTSGKGKDDGHACCVHDGKVCSYHEDCSDIQKQRGMEKRNDICRVALPYGQSGVPDFCTMHNPCPIHPKEGENYNDLGVETDKD
jgi:hypothetical protein